MLDRTNAFRLISSEDARIISSSGPTPSSHVDIVMLAKALHGGTIKSVRYTGVLKSRIA